MAVVPIPVRASVRDLLRDVLGAKVTVSEDARQELDPERTAYLAAYKQDNGRPVVVAIFNLTGAAAMGGAIGMMDASDVAIAMDGKTALEGDLYDSFSEVVGAFGKLLNSPTTKHVKLDTIYPVPGEVPANIAAIVTGPGTRTDYTIAVEGHLSGVLTLVSI